MSKGLLWSKGIEKQKREVEENAAAVADPSTPKEQTLRSVSKVLNFYTHCLFCEKEVDEEKKYKISTKNREIMYYWILRDSTPNV